jgi:hypothetical protein
MLSVVQRKVWKCPVCVVQLHSFNTSTSFRFSFLGGGGGLDHILHRVLRIGYGWEGGICRKNVPYIVPVPTR